MTLTDGERFTLPDGRSVSCPNEQDAAEVWGELSGDSGYDLAALDLRDGDLLVDVGAHVGLAAMHFADQLPNSRIVACEPAPRSFACLRDNLARFVPSAVAINAAVGAAPGTAQLTFYPHKTTMSTLHVDEHDDWRNVEAVLTNVGLTPTDRASRWERSRQDAQRVSVPVRTLPDILAEHGVSEVGLLKIDVERGELGVLRGIDEPTWRRIHHVLLEVHDVDGALDEVRMLLRTWGFDVTVVPQRLFAGGSVHGVIATRPRA